MSFMGLIFGLSGCSMGPMFIQEMTSPYGFDETVTTVVENARGRGWLVPETYDFQKSLIAHGHADPGRLTVIKLCSPALASRMFAADDSKYVSVMAPCSISVYEKSDGRTYLSAMDMGLMSTLIGGEVGSVLNEIAREDAEIVRFAESAE
jgi:uncharacterized protein (DUF302 family)